MSAETETLERLQAAVSAEPDNVLLRVGFARLLVDAGQFEEALRHCVLALDRAPGNKEALDLAVLAAGRVAGRRRPSASLLTGWVRAWALRPSGPKPASRPPGLGWSPVESSKRQPGVLRPIDLHLGVVEQPGATLEDLRGMPLVRSRITSGFLGPLRHSDMRRLYGRSLRGGLLLYGPPGCGKTFLARATAGELGASFLAVDLGNVLDMWLSYSEQTLHELFERARAHAPCVLFIDELDALGRKRAQRRYSVGRNVVVQLVAELHAVRQETEDVVVVAASAQPWEADILLRQPGRFDHRLLVLPPDHEARESILRAQLDGQEVAGLTFEDLAAQTEGLTAAELIELCREILLAAAAASPAGGPLREITAADFRRQLALVQPSAPKWFAAARDHLRYSGESASYEELAGYLRATRW